MDLDPRSNVCEGLGNDGKVASAGGAVLVLDDVWPLVKQVDFIEDAFFKDFPEKVPALARYKEFAAAFCEMGEYLFRQLPSYQHLPKLHPTAASMRCWANTLPEQLKVWVCKSELLELADKACFQRCAQNLTALFSAGLEAVAQVVAQAQKGETPLTQQSKSELLSKIPSDHPLRALVVAFFEACRVGPANSLPKHPRARIVY